MATIFDRGDGQYQVKVRVKGHPAKSKTFTIKQDAIRWGRETEIAIERGLFFDRSVAERTTVSALIKRYKDEELQKKKGKYFNSCLKQLEDVFGEYSLSSITSAMIAKHRDTRLKTVGASTVKKEINTLSVIIDLAGKEWGIQIASNPCAMVKRPIEPKGRDRRLIKGEGLIKGEEEKIMIACKNHEASVFLVAIVRLALETGCRASELLKLEWVDVDLTKRTAKLWETKNGENRTIPLSSSAVIALQSLPRHINGRVFNSWCAVESLNKAWKKSCERAEISDLRFHDLRHEAISRLFEKGLNIMEVAHISGHKTLTMLKRYTHLKAEDLALKLG